MFCLQCGQRLSAAEPDDEVLAETRAEALAPEDLRMPPSGSPGGQRAPASIVQLRVEQGSVDEQVISLDRPETVIGRRRETSDVVIHDTNVSRRHARIVHDGSRLTIEDTGSSNGTLVNDERIQGQREIGAGDVIRIGDAVFIVEQIEAPAEPFEQYEGSTMAIDMDSPMTSLGGAPELVPPMLSGGPVGPHGPLTPPPPIMDPHGTSIVDSPPVPEPVEAVRNEPPPPPPPVTAPPDPVPPRPQARPESVDGLRRELAEVGSQLVGFAGTLGGLADRVERLEQALDEASGDLNRVAEAVRGPDATVLRELQGIIEEIERDGDEAGLEEAMNVLEQLSSNPRDIELLLKLSQQAQTLEGALRVHGRLIAVAPRVRASLGRLVD
jgi:hypothetical protein